MGFRPSPTLTFLAAVLLSTAAATAAEPASEGLVAGSPAAGIYGSNHLQGLPDKVQLVFDYRFEGSAMEKPFSDDVALAFSRGPGTEGDFDVEVTVFSQTRNQVVGPISAASVNPILLIFFQRDVTHMSNGTGGSQHYFRNAIRRALQTPDEDSVHAITVDLDGRQIAASEVSFKPFAGDANRARLRGFADKTYRVVLSKEVPGGIYEVETETPGENGEGMLLRESYRFREIRQ
jgi:hypothetical protein